MLFALVLSVLLNLGVLGAVGYRVFQSGQLPAVFGGDAGGVSLPDHLKLSTEQREKWQALESGFLREAGAEWQRIRAHREAMIHEIFSDRPDRGRIEAERAAIAQLQTDQQRRVIEQLLRESEILDRAQRLALAELLIRQAPTATAEERLHGQ